MSRRYVHRLSYDPGNFQGVGTRSRQEDSFGFVNAGDVKLIGQKGLLAIVADGIGGLGYGTESSTIAVNTLRTDYEKYDFSQHPGMQLARSIIRANETVYQSFHRQGGSTITATIFYDEKLYFASVGDSTIWLVRDNEVIRLNEPHNLRHRIYRMTLENGSTDPFPARNDPHEHSLTEFIGNDTIRTVDMNYRPLSLKDGDVIVLCSDGVGDVLSPEEVLHCLNGRSSNEAAAIMETLIRDKKRPSQDNYTAIIVRCMI